jgi:hypothetical protein
MTTKSRKKGRRDISGILRDLIPLVAIISITLIVGGILTRKAVQ